MTKYCLLQSNKRRITELKQLITPKQFYRGLYHYIDSDICNGEIRNFASKGELYNFLKENKQFGVVSFEGVYFSKDEENFDPEIDEVSNLDTNSDIEWKGPGDYVAWSWGDEHIERIDDVYEELIEDYVKGDFEPPSDEVVEEMYSKLYFKSNDK